MHSTSTIDLKVYAQKKLFLPLVILVADIIFYVATLIVTFQLALPWKLLMIVPIGFAISFLFLIGHDAAHNSFTKSKLLNQIIGRLVFLPTFHSFTAWVLSHNRIHHAHTNLKDVDDVFNPLSKEEFEQLSSLGKLSYKFKRTALGHGWMYFQELWWPKMVFPGNSGKHKSERSALKSALIYDVLLLVGYTAVFFYLLGSLTNVLVMGILPFLFWNWLMGWVTFQQHTHPEVKWYDNQHEWNYTEAQVEGTMHVVYPPLLNMSFHYIMEHTAHHLRPDIPMYNLKKAQSYLETVFENAPKTQWSIKDYIRALNKCKLYDYENNCWTNYKGEPTS